MYDNYQSAKSLSTLVALNPSTHHVSIGLPEYVIETDLVSVSVCPSALYIAAYWTVLFFFFFCGGRVVWFFFYKSSISLIFLFHFQTPETSTEERPFFL